MRLTPQALFAAAIGAAFHLFPSAAHAEVSTMPHPDDSSKTVEYFLEKPAGRRPWPAVVFVHGHQEGVSLQGGADFARWGVLDRFAKRGYLAVAVSQPGYGNSTGPADFCGPFSQHAVSGVISKLRAEGYLSTNRVVLVGISRGALIAGLIAARDPAIAGIVLISGLYDLPGFAASARSPQAKQIVNAIIAETGGGRDALRIRSVLNFAPGIQAAALILNGAQDDRTDPEQARLLARRIASHGGNARAIVYAEYGHQIPVRVRDKEIDPFIEDVLRGGK
jgi:dipeptidyl aminopeptidase/acylaminoacyl peptidase